MWFVQLIEALAWPLVAVFAIWNFKPGISQSIPDLLRRKFNIRVPGFEATVEAAEQQKVIGEKPTDIKLTENGALAPHHSEAINLIEAHLNAEVSKIEETSKIPLLVRSLSIARLVGQHEFVYNRILGSQIAGLKELNVAGTASQDEAQRFYQTYADKFPELYNNFRFEVWLHFLLSHGLVNKLPGSRLEITPFARDFLKYMTDNRLSEHKPF